jgi:hypothetical protein
VTDDKNSLGDLAKSALFAKKAETGSVIRSAPKNKTLDEIVLEIIQSNLEIIQSNLDGCPDKAIANTRSIVQLALMAERERAGKIADIWANTKPTTPGPTTALIATVTCVTAKKIADAIRDDATPLPVIPEIKIEVSGGVVSGVSSTGPARVVIYDYDHLADDEGEDDCEATVHEFGEGGKAL